MNVEWAEEQENKKARENTLNVRLALHKRHAEQIGRLNGNRGDINDVLFVETAKIAIELLDNVRFLAKLMASHHDPVLKITAAKVLERSEAVLEFGVWR